MTLSLQLRFSSEFSKGHSMHLDRLLKSCDFLPRKLKAPRISRICPLLQFHRKGFYSSSDDLWIFKMKAAKRICCTALHYYVKNDKRSMYEGKIELTHITWTTELFHAPRSSQRLTSGIQHVCSQS